MTAGTEHNLVAVTNRYASDFQEIKKIGEGGFGQVFMARHLIDGNIYAIKKIKLQSKANSDANRRIRREFTYLSTLNNQYIVRYVQTWVEVETDPEKIAEFEDESDEYDSEEEDSELDSGTFNDSLSDRGKNKGGQLPFAGLQAEVDPCDISESPRRKRALTDQTSILKGLKLKQTQIADNRDDPAETTEQYSEPESADL